MHKSFFRRFSKKIFIISNIITAICFIAGCYGKFFLSIGWWPVGFLSLAAFYLLLLLVLFIVFWLFVRPSWSLVSLVAILMAIGQIYNIIPFRFSSGFELSGAATDLRIMSWNVAQFDILFNKQKPETRDEMLTVVNQYKPDIACFQEMVAGDTLINLDTEYYKRYSFFSVFEYAARLNYPYHHFSYNFRDDFLNHQHFGLIIFSRYPIINQKTLTFEPYDYNSNFQYVDIVKENDTFRVFNVHLQSLKFTPGNLEYIQHPSLETKQDIKRSKNLLEKFKNGFLKRKLQSDRVASEIEKSPYPVVVCGDFNDVPNSYAYSRIKGNLQDAFLKKGSGLGRTFSGIAPTLRIDNIFTSKTFTIHQFLLVNKKLSDHFPIIADIGR